MPFESRLFVKTSLVALALVFVWGAAMAFEEAAGRPFPQIWAVEHAHLAFVGWLVNLVIGIALWMLPLDRQRYPKTQGRYPPHLPITFYLCLNVGLVLRIISEPFAGAAPIASAVLVLSAVLQVLGIVLFAWVAWTRTRAPSHPAPGVR